jgi:hypothetical protein
LQPSESSDFTTKVACLLYLAYEKKAKKAAKSADTLLIETNHPIYIRDYFPEVFGCSRTLQNMKELEKGADLDSLSDLVDTKCKTRLNSTWTEADTKAATETATNLVKQLRDLENDPSTVAVTDAEWLQWYSFEARFRLITEARLAALPASPAGTGRQPATLGGRGRTLVEPAVETSEKPKGIFCRIFVNHSIASQ